ncbi:MAG: sortase [Anaerolineales bacterium]
MDKNPELPGMRTAVEDLETGRRLGSFVGNLFLRLIGLGALAAVGIYLWNVFDVPNLPIVTKLGLSAEAPLASRIEILPVSPTYEELVAARGEEPTPAPLVPVAGIDVGTIQPQRLEIPSIDLDAPVLPVGFVQFEQTGGNYVQWQVPDEYAVGWHGLSAGLGEAGNTVLNGHNNVFGEVFRFLDQVVVGDVLNVYSGGQLHAYRVTESLILAERDQPIEVRQENAKWIAPSDDERITLVSCYPYQSNSHRLIVVAQPVDLPSNTDLGLSVAP